MGFYGFLFVVDLVTIIYFYKMALSYLSILSMNFPIKRMKFIFWTGLVAVWLVFTLLRVDIYFMAIQLYGFVVWDLKLIGLFIKGLPNRIMIYFTKFTPFLLTLYILKILTYFSDDMQKKDASVSQNEGT